MGPLNGCVRKNLNKRFREKFTNGCKSRNKWHFWIGMTIKVNEWVTLLNVYCERVFIAKNWEKWNVLSKVGESTISTKVDI